MKNGTEHDPATDGARNARREIIRQWDLIRGLRADVVRLERDRDAWRGRAKELGRARLSERAN